MKNILIFATIFLLNTCNEPNQLTTFINEQGEIKIFVCSRGCYQYLLAHQGDLYYPGELPEDLKKDGIKVIFSGELKDTETAINKPAPNDVPIFDFHARDIDLKSIE